MKRKLTNSKALLLLLVLVMCFVFPMKAQNNDAFLRNDKLYGDRDAGAIGGYIIGTQGFGSDVFGGYNISTQQFGQELPLGSGLLILLGAGACYIKRKKTLADGLQ